MLLDRTLSTARKIIVETDNQRNNKSYNEKNIIVDR